MNEIWKDIDGYEGYYQISNLGNIKSNKTNKILKPIKQNCGYRKIELHKDGTKKMFYIHRLVALAFLENKGNKIQVNHIDGDKTNNKASNLEWCFASENQQHALKNGLHAPSPMKGKFGKDNPNSKKINQYDLNGNFIKTWDSIADAKRCYKVDIHVCLIGKNKTAGGFIWKYV